MCLSVREEQQLDGIGEDVRLSDARLASMMVIFGRLTAGEPLPDREQLAAPAGRGRAALHAVAAGAARLIAWLDGLDSPPARPEPRDRERRAA
jgi:hypothetical protein